MIKMYKLLKISEKSKLMLPIATKNPWKLSQHNHIK